MKRPRLQNKKPNAPKRADVRDRIPSSRHQGFKFRSLFFAFLLGLATGSYVGYDFAQSYVEVTASDALRDRYGRSPGHPHYQHNHP